MAKLLRLWFPVLLVLLAGFLAYQHVQLARVNNTLRETIIRDASEQVREGERIVEFAGASLTGTHRRLSIRDFPSGLLVIALSAGCGVCQQNHDQWQQLGTVARDSGIAVLWMSRDAPDQMKTFVGPQEDKGDLVIADPSYWSYRRLKMQLVPQTVVVGPDGAIRKAMAGVLSTTNVADLATALKGLSAVSLGR